MRLLRFGGRGGGSAHREKLLGRDAGLSCNDSEGTGERRTLAHTDGKKRRCACNETKLLEKGPGTDEPPVTGTLAL